MCHRGGACRLLLVLSVVCAALGPGSADSAQPPKPAIRPAGGRILWAHLVPWFSVKVYDVNRRDFALGMGLDHWPGLDVVLRKDREVQCRLAAEAGIDGFAVDLPAGWSSDRWIRTLAPFFKAAETLRNEGRRFLMSPCLDGHSRIGPDKTAERIAALLDAWGDSPCWPRLEGRWIVWTYSGGTFSPEQWRRVTTRLEAKGRPILLVLDLNAWLHNRVTLRNGELPVAAADRIREWAPLPALFYAFRGESMGAPKWRAVRRLLNRLAAERTAPLAGLSVGTVWPGYWSIKYNYRAEPAGFTWLKRTIEASRDCDWVCVVTWNDYGEDTHFEPSLAYGRGRVALLREFAAQWRGARLPADPQPPVLVWQPCAVRVGEDLRCEVGAWFRSTTPAAPIRISLALIRSDGSPADVPVTVVLGPTQSAGLTRQEVRFPASVLTPGQWVRIAGDFACGGKSRRAVGPPTPVWPSRYDPVMPRRGAMWGPGDDVRLDLRFEAARPDADSPVREIRASWPAAGSERGPLYLMQNLRLVYFQPGAAVEHAARRLAQRISAGRQPWQVFRSIPEKECWGFFGAFGVTPSGQRFASPFIWTPPPAPLRPDCVGFWNFDEGKGETVSDAGPYGSVGRLAGAPMPEWVLPGRAGRACLRFKGGGYIALPPGRTPRGVFTVQAWVRPDRVASPGTRCIYTDTGGFIFVLDKDNRLHLQARTTGPGKWTVARSRSGVPPERWTHVAAVCDGRTLRVYIDGRPEGEATAPAGDFQSMDAAIGCNPFGKKSAFFRGLIDAVRLDARVLPIEVPEFGL